MDKAQDEIDSNFVKINAAVTFSNKICLVKNKTMIFIALTTPLASISKTNYEGT
jgi:hypothetical protein